jgi:hypothetical protein
MVRRVLRFFQGKWKPDMDFAIDTLENITPLRNALDKLYCWIYYRFAMNNAVGAAWILLSL